MNDNNSNNVLIEIIQPGKGEVSNYVPVIGPEVLSLMKNLMKVPEEEKVQIINEATAILARCGNAWSTNTTGLAIGYVQSGKTMSFTTITALARDNEFQMVILITGISTPLFAQSSKRLEDDLRLNSRIDRSWRYFQNPKLKNGDELSIKASLQDWKDSSVPKDERQTILVTVMKNHQHLENFINVLSKLDLRNVPVMIIDDEADQAGLNTLVQQGDVSTTYRQLLNLRRVIPHHKFIQYTATPQAPLLINIIDMLSPDFAEVLTPGSNYVGGKEFFIINRELVRTIPDKDIPQRSQKVVDPPESLLEAMRIYFLGVAAGLILSGGAGNRSMLVHPSQKTKRHKLYYQWVSLIQQNWQTILEAEITDPDRIELVNEFNKSYFDLSKTVSNLPDFAALEKRLLHAVRRTNVKEVNASKGKTPQIDWKAAYPYILVGGQAMDRGFTIEGLTVTYMPRNIGGGNADTVQQRARFFGYKREYLGFCRVYLERDLRDAYRKYISHEEDIRNQLIEYRNSQKPLSEWKRAFFLDRNLKPTRDCVLDLDYMRGGYSDEWYSPKSPHYSPEANMDNKKLVFDLINQLSLQPEKGNSERTDYQRHSIDNNVLLSELYEKLLVKYLVAYPNDSQKYTGLLIQIRNYIEKNPYETCAVYLISYPNGNWITREYQADDATSEIDNLFQGKNPKTGYAGDREIFIPEKLSVQIRKLRVKNSTGSIVAESIYPISIRVPSKMSGDWVVQK